jgi:hypothetical protein
MIKRCDKNKSKLKPKWNSSTKIDPISKQNSINKNFIEVTESSDSNSRRKVLPIKPIKNHHFNLIKNKVKNKVYPSKEIDKYHFDNQPKNESIELDSNLSDKSSIKELDDEMEHTNVEGLHIEPFIIVKEDTNEIDFDRNSSLNSELSLFQNLEKYLNEQEAKRNKQEVQDLKSQKNEKFNLKQVNLMLI